MHDFTVLLLDGAYASSVCATLDILAAAHRLAPRLGVVPPKWKTLCFVDRPVVLQGGLSIAARTCAGGSRADRSVWIVPGLGVSTADDLQRRLAAPDARSAAATLKRHVALGGGVAASCSSVFLLHQAGLLDGRRVTTSWWLAPALRRLAPLARIDADRMVCADGPMVTAGAAFAQTDLMLHLLRTHGGHDLANVVSRFLLIHGRAAQAPFVIPEVLAGGDELVARVAAEIERSLPAPPSVAELASRLHLSERTLARHVTRATGKTTLALIQSVRLRRARTLLASSRMSIDQVAAEVGYQDATALRRMMRRALGMNPSELRAAQARA